MFQLLGNVLSKSQLFQFPESTQCRVDRFPRYFIGREETNQASPWRVRMLTFLSFPRVNSGQKENQPSREYPPRGRHYVLSRASMFTLVSRTSLAQADPWFSPRTELMRMDTWASRCHRRIPHEIMFEGSPTTVNAVPSERIASFKGLWHDKIMPVWQPPLQACAVVPFGVGDGWSVAGIEKTSQFES